MVAIVPKGDQSLLDDEVHVWRIGSGLSRVSEFRHILAAEELERADRFHFEADRRRSITGRGCLRLLLGKLLQRPAESLRFEYDEFGKPRLPLTPERGLRFNVSHSGDLILIAIAKGRAVGVDVEKVRFDFDLESISARFFSFNENDRLTRLTGSRKYDAFFTCWTRKEAYLKARGDGLSLPLDQFDVSFLADEEPQLLETRHDPAEAKRWTLRSVAVPSGYVAAVVAEGAGWKLKHQDWSDACVAGHDLIRY
jgi:4'-phosphopantetheinyl transferase